MPQKYISPWPAADAMRRRAMSTGRNTWKQPEPPPKPKPRQYFILGMEVDYNTYREFMYNREYRIDGDILKDVVCWLPMLERYATEEHAKEYPIEAANARKILDQIREEIKTITGKEDETMSNPKTASDFLRELQTIYTETRSQYATLNESVVKAEKQLERAQEKARGGDSIAQARLEVARADLREAQDACRTEYGKMMNNYNARVKELRGQFADHLNKHYAASPDKLDAATMQLLGSGICSPDELFSLVERHKDSPTMVRIIGSYADKMIENRKNMEPGQINALQAVRNYAAVAKNGNREMEIFDTAVSTAAYGLGKDYNHATRMDSHVGEWFTGYADKMDNLPIVPDTMAPSAAEPPAADPGQGAAE